MARTTSVNVEQPAPEVEIEVVCAVCGKPVQLTEAVAVGDQVIVGGRP